MAKVGCGSTLRIHRHRARTDTHSGEAKERSALRGGQEVEEERGSNVVAVLAQDPRRIAISHDTVIANTYSIKYKTVYVCTLTTTVRTVYVYR